MQNEFYEKVKNLEEIDPEKIHDIAFCEAMDEFRGLSDFEKISHSARVFANFVSVLKELNIDDTKNIKEVLSGVKSALSVQKEEEILNLIYDYEKIKREIFYKKDEVKSLVSKSFEEIEKFFANDKEIEDIKDIIKNEIYTEKIIKEASESAFLTTMENANDIRMNAKMVAKKMVYNGIKDEKPSKFQEVVSIVLMQGSSVASENHGFCKELLSGVVEGAYEGLIEANEKFKDEHRHVSTHIRNSQSENFLSYKELQESFIAILKDVSSQSSGSAKYILEGILQKEYDNYFSRAKSMPIAMAKDIKDKLSVLDIEENYKEISKAAIEKFEEFKNTISEKRAKIYENFEIDEKISSLKGGLENFEKKALAKISEFKNPRKDKDEDKN